MTSLQDFQDLTPPHKPNSQTSIISFKYVDSKAKIFLILYLPFETSTTRIAILPISKLKLWMDSKHSNYVY